MYRATNRHTREGENPVPASALRVEKLDTHLRGYDGLHQNVFGLLTQ